MLRLAISTQPHALHRSPASKLSLIRQCQAYQNAYTRPPQQHWQSLPQRCGQFQHAVSRSEPSTELGYALDYALGYALNFALD